MSRYSHTRYVLTLPLVVPLVFAGVVFALFHLVGGIGVYWADRAVDWLQGYGPGERR